MRYQTIPSILFAVWLQPANLYLLRRNARFSPRFLGPLVCCLLTACSNPAPQSEFGGTSENLRYLWSEFGPDGKIIVRSVVDGNQCPQITIDATSYTMRRRAAHPPESFDSILVCEQELPPGVKSASIDGHRVAVPARDANKIVVLGDTGCRIKGKKIQNCTGLGQGKPWDFKGLVQAIREESPDLIVHLGDYHYRERGTCDQRCLQHTIGDTWISWQAEFFEPAKPILNLAPWVFVRGNHENCERSGWQGWFYLLDPGPLDPGFGSGSACKQHSKPYRVTGSGYNIIVLDTADIPDDEYSQPPPSELVAQYSADMVEVKKLASSETPGWVVGHRPFWALATEQEEEGTVLVPLGATLRAAIDHSGEKDLPASIRMLLSGHVHLFQYLSFGNNRPAQFIFGGGGTMLDPELTGSLIDRNPGVLRELKLDRKRFRVVNELSYGVIKPVPDGWKVTVKNAFGEAIMQIAVAGH